VQFTTGSLRTATSSTISRVNTTAIVDALREHGPLSRQQIGAVTGLSPATVNRITAVLVADGLVVVLGHAESSGGRPPILLEYTGGARVIACLQFQATEVRGALVDLDANIVHRETVPVDDLPEPEPDGDGGARLARALALLDRLLDAARTAGRPCAAVGVTVPGVVRNPEGVLESLPPFGWPEFGLRQLIADRVGLPVTVENDANAIAVGEFARGAGRDAGSLVAIELANGLGAGIISNGRLHRGFASQAGEIGYLLMGTASLAQPHELLGDLEDRVGAMGMARAARARGMEVAAGSMLLVEDVFGRAAAGEAAAQTLAEELMDIVAVAVAAVAVVLDPELIVLGGGLAVAGATTVPGIRRRLDGRIMRVPTIEAAEFGHDSVLIGVAELASHRVRDPAYVAD